jgi:hypothetical protein
MTTLTIEIPDNDSSIISAITNITQKAGLKISIDTDDEGLNESEFKALQDACKEAVLIKKGLSKAIPASELWND